jgi:4-amino-4-deoxy-L-arabinose transferase-like glycosyltransferase
MLTSGSIPLVGIASSHPWLHQGALWTYMLAPILWLFSYNPVSGAYLSITFFIVTIFLIYKLGAEMFSKSAGAIAAYLFATSPLIILNARAPYHTSPIPFFTLIFLYALYKWIHGNRYFFPLIIFILALLYNLEIATSVVTFVFLIIFIFGLLKKSLYARNVLQPRIIILSILAFILPMFPMIVYDFGHGFPQTVKFVAWIGYKILTLFGYPPLHADIPSADFKTVFQFLANNYQRLVYLPNSFVSSVLALLSFGYLIILLKKQFTNKKYDVSVLLLGVLCIVTIGGVLATKTPSDAYLPMLFPLIILVLSLFFARLLSNKTTSKLLIGCVIMLIGFMNVYTLLELHYYTEKGATFSDKIAVAKQIVSEANGRGYNLKGKGNGSQFASFTDTYKYLTWWQGNAPSEKKEKLQFVVTESAKKITVTKK